MFINLFICLLQVPTDMGNKPSVSEGEDDEDRAPISYPITRPIPVTSELPNGGAEDADDEVELPPPMKPIQEPILVPPVSGVTVIEENPCKRVSILLYHILKTLNLQLYKTHIIIN